MLESLTRAYQYLIFFGNLLKSPILLLCRLYWGWHFLLAGWEKLENIDYFIQFLGQYHFPFHHFFAYLVGYTEFLGGLCLFIGFASRLAAIPLIITMLTAYVTVHKDAFHALLSSPSLFVAEAPFNFLLTALIVLAFGPGRFSIDFIFERWLFQRAQAIPKHQHLR
ncbi:DoxX family protein [Candidatus Protochlamydia phocaeensis]|uniref:DoxX family protein n=1 Tax=Candidatus Protochlamydia phocaeensis TaxID=1414722 RepID=UPI0008388FBF|nr:DoxX family protein [Candidatus Protochlamydia phocaeensis]